MPSKLKKYILSAVLFILSVSALSVSFTVSASDGIIKMVKAEISRDGEKILLEAEIEREFAHSHRSDKVYFFELAPGQSEEDINSIEPSAHAGIGTSVSVELDYDTTKLYCSYVAALLDNDGTYSPASKRRFITNPDTIASNVTPFPEPPTKKGLCAQITSDAQYLGAAHTTINIDINEYMSAAYGENTVPYLKNGQSFYFFSDKLNALDHKVKVLTEAGINVYFNIVLSRADPSGLGQVFPTASSEGASLYAVNTNSFVSAKYFAAFCEFMSERYSGSSGENGFVPAYILGYEVDSPSWNYAGDISFEEYAQNYEKAYRILYNAVKSVYKNGRIFVSVSNTFNAPDSNSSSYGYKRFLDKFAETVRENGEIAWALAVNPYPSDPSLTEFWNDEKAVDSISTECITMKNLGVLSEYMRLDTMTYNGRVRDIIIGEFGVGGSYDEAKSNDCQAAAYALAYAIADQNEDIDAFIYYRHVDYPAETVKFGLWTSIASSPLTPVDKKAIYTVFRNADTAAYTDGLEMAKAFCGNDIYGKYLKDYSPTPKKVISEIIPIAKSDIRTTYRETAVFDLTQGETCGFYPADNCSYVELRQISSDSFDTMLYSKMRPVSGVTYMGISRSVAERDLLDGEFITVYFKPVTPSNQTLNVMLRLDGESNGISHTFEGVVQLNSNENSELTFKITDFLKETDGNISSLKLWFKPSSGIIEDGEYGMWLEKITVHSKTGLSTLVTVIAVFFIILLAGAVIFAAVHFATNRKLRNKVKEIKGKVKWKIIGFLKNKKIISRKKKRLKGAPRAGARLNQSGGRTSPRLNVPPAQRTSARRLPNRSGSAKPDIARNGIKNLQNSNSISKQNTHDNSENQ